MAESKKKKMWTKWTMQQTILISDHFEKYIIRYADSRELPSKTECKQFLTKNGIKGRTADELYYKIYNDAKKLSRV